LWLFFNIYLFILFVYLKFTVAQSKSRTETNDIKQTEKLQGSSYIKETTDENIQNHSNLCF